jgi:ligand-binding sensor domain-containing protein/anti-sigma regulatory factor (Ser/Thr protein kinase)
MLFRFYIYLVLFLSQAHAQQSIDGFKRYGRAEALPNSNNNKIFESSDKFLWLATSSGLYQFDGFLFTPYFSNSKDSNSLSSNVLSDIEEDRHGNLWVGTFGKGVNKRNKKTGRWKQYIHPTKDDNTFYWIFDLFKDANGNLWLGTSGRGLLLYDETKDAFQQFFPSPSKNKTGTVRFENEVRAIDADKNNADVLWLAGTDGLYQFNTIQKTFTCYINNINGEEEWINNSFHDIYVKDAQNIWLGAWGGGLVHFYIPTNTFTNYPPAPLEYKKKNLARNIINAIDSASNSSLYVSTSSDGLLEFNIINKRFKKISKEALPDSKVAPTPFYGITHAADGSTWICSAENIYQKHPVYNRLAQYQSFYQPTNAFVYKPSLNSVLYVKQNMEYWMSCNAGFGVYVYDSNFQYKSSIPIEGDAIDKRLRNLVQDGARNFWLFSLDAPYLYKYDPTTNMFKNANRYFKKSTFINADLQTIGVDAGGNLWCVNADELMVWDERIQKMISYKLKVDTKDRLPLKITKIKFDAMQDPWLITSVGLFHFKKKEKTLHLIYPQINQIQPNKNSAIADICFDADGRCYIAPEDEGIHVYDELSKKFIQHYSRAEGFISQRVNCLQTDKDGNIWAVTIDGLAQFNNGQQRWYRFGTDDGLTTDRLYEPLFSMADGNMILANEQGFVHWKTGALPLNTQKPIVYFSSLSSSEKSIPIKDAIYLSASENNVNIEFSAIVTVMGNRTNFYYKMAPKQKEWVAANQRSISLVGLSGGHYTLQVKAVNADGVESDIKSLQINVAYPIWQRWWFIVLAILFTGGLLYLIYRYRVAQLIKIEKMRNHISRDLHDEIGSSVSSVNILSNVAKDQLGNEHPVAPLLTQIGLSAQQAGESINEIIWSIHPKNDSAEKIVLRMKELAADAFEMNKIQYQLHFDPALQQLQIPMQQRQHLTMIYKEALNNMIKYSACTEANLKMQVTGKMIELTIQDNGVGFDVGSHQSGYGLKNMQERAKEMKGSLSINTLPGKGCGIVLKFPFK